MGTIVAVDGGNGVGCDGVGTEKMIASWVTFVIMAVRSDEPI